MMKNVNFWTIIILGSITYSLSSQTSAHSTQNTLRNLGNSHGIYTRVVYFLPDQYDLPSPLLTSNSMRLVSRETDAHYPHDISKEKRGSDRHW